MARRAFGRRRQGLFPATYVAELRSKIREPHREVWVVSGRPFSGGSAIDRQSLLGSAERFFGPSELAQANSEVRQSMGEPWSVGCWIALGQPSRD